jgi:DNA polymerase
MAWTERQRAMLQALGLGLWVTPISSDDDVVGVVETQPASDSRTVPETIGRGLDGTCATCPRRMTPIESRGATAPSWMVVGGAPEPDDVEACRAFAGAPGELLQRMLHAVGLPADGQGQAAGVRLALAVRCAPAEGRVPAAEQLTACAAWIRAEIERLRPRVVLALGRTAAEGLLGPGDAIARRRGVVHRLGAVPVVVTHELPFLLRQPEGKAEAWDDLCLAIEAAETGASPPAH